MQSENLEPELIAEERLVSTLITGKPSIDAFIVASLTVLVITLVSLFYWQAPTVWSDLLPAANEQVFSQHQIWRLFTAVFIHADMEHLLSNMYMLWIFIFFVFGYFGFGVFPVLSLFIAGLVNALAVYSYAPQIQLLGASGLVYILGGFWLTLYLLVQRQYKFINRLMRVLGIAVIIFMPSTFVPSTSYRTHAIGFAAGVLMGIFYFYKNKKEIRSHEIYKISLV